MIKEKKVTTLLRILTAAAAGFSVVLGLLVITGWHTHTVALIQVHPAYVPMQYNTAMGFLLSGFGVLGLLYGRPRAALACGALVAAIGLVTLMEYLFGVDLGIDELLMEHYIGVKTSHMGRMAPNTALCFMLTGVALLAFNICAAYKRCMLITGTLASVILGLGIIAFTGYMTGLESAYGWGNLTRMAVHTAFGFMVLGFGLLMLSLMKEEGRWLPYWLPAPVVIAVLTFTVSLWQALPHGPTLDVVTHLSHYFVLGFGMVLAVALAVAVYLAQKAVSQTASLAASEERFRQLAENIEEVFWLTDWDDNRVIYTSPAFESVWGKKRDLIYKDPMEWMASIHPDDRERVEALFVNLVSTGGFDTEYRIVQPDGTLRWIHDKGYPIKNEMGKVYRIAGVAHDVTERVLTENALRLITEGTASKTGEEFLGEFTMRLAEALGVSCAFISELVEGGTEMLRTVTFWDGDKLLSPFEYPTKGTPCEVVLREGEACVTAGVQNQFPEDHYLVEMGAESYAAMTLIDSLGNRVGHMGIIGDRPIDKKAFVIMILKLFASRVGAEVERMHALEALRRNEQLLREAQSIAGVGHWELDPKTGKVNGSNELYHIFGLDREDSTLDAFADAVHPDDREEDLRHIRRGMEHGEPWNIEHRLVMKDGSLKWVRAIGKPLLDADGKVNRLIGTVQDISEYKFTALALEESEERLNRGQEVGHVGTWDWSPVTGELLWSDETFRIHGYTPGEVTPSYELFLERVHPDDRERLNSAVEKAVKEKAPYNIDCRIITKEGEERLANAQGKVIYDKEGNPVRMLGTFQDITERVVTERALSEHVQEAAHLGRIIEDSLNEVYVFDSKSLKFIAVNNGARKNLGYTMDEMKELTPLDLKPEFTEESFVRLVEPLRAGKQEKLLFDTVHRRKDGSFYPVQVHLQTSTYGERDVFVAIILDITIRKKYEEDLIKAKEGAEAASRAKSDFLSRMSHELRTPLNSILGFAQVLDNEKEEMAARQRICIEEIETAGWHLTNLIDEVLDIARIESGRLELKLELIEICPLVEECVSAMTPQAENRKIKISFNLEQCSLNRLRSDRVRLKEVLLNLLSNAVNYNVESGFVSVECKKVKSGRLRICVTNSGPVIPETEKGRLFEPFARIEGTDTAIQGMGVGLAISKQLIELMGGSIGLVESTKKGNTFCIEVPLDEGGEEVSD